MEFDAIRLPPRRARMTAQGLWHDRTINDELDACVTACPDRLALTAMQVETGDMRRFSYRELAQMADRIKVLLKGEEIEEADTRRMLSAPQEDYTKSLWAVRDVRRAPLPEVPGADTPLFAIEGVSAAYGALKVLDNISLSIHRGRTVAIVGES